MRCIEQANPDTLYGIFEGRNQKAYAAEDRLQKLLVDAGLMEVGGNE